MARIVYNGPDHQSVFADVNAQQPEVTIGRQAGNTLRIASNALSRVHAKIVFQNGRYFLVDNNSSNGSYVNGARVANQEIHLGDKIRCGNVSLEFIEEPRGANSPGMPPMNAGMPPSNMGPIPVNKGPMPPLNASKGPMPFPMNGGMPPLNNGMGPVPMNKGPMPPLNNGMGPVPMNKGPMPSLNNGMVPGPMNPNGMPSLAPTPMGPGPNGMGPGPNSGMGPLPSLGPAPMGPGPNGMGPGPNSGMGPGPNSGMGPGPNSGMGPLPSLGPAPMGPGGNMDGDSSPGALENRSMPGMPGPRGGGMAAPKLQMMSPGLQTGGGPAASSANINLRPISGGGNYRPTMINQPSFDQDMERYAAQQMAQQNSRGSADDLDQPPFGRPDVESRFPMDNGPEPAPVQPPQGFVPLSNTPVQPVSSVEPSVDDFSSPDKSSSPYADKEAEYLNDGAHLDQSHDEEPGEIDRYDGRIDDGDMGRYDGRIDDGDMGRYDGRIDDGEIDRYDGRIDDGDMGRYDHHSHEDYGHVEPPMEEPAPVHEDFVPENVPNDVPEPQVPEESPVHLDVSSDSGEDIDNRAGGDRFAGRGRGRIAGRVSQRPTLSRVEAGPASSQQPAARRATHPSNPAVPIPNSSIGATVGGRRPQRGRVPVAHGRMSGQIHVDVEEQPVAVLTESPIAVAVSEVESPDEFRAMEPIEQLQDIDQILPEVSTPDPSLIGETINPNMVEEAASPAMLAKGEDPYCVGKRPDSFKLSSAYLGTINPESAAAEIEVSEYKSRLSAAQLEVQKLSVACEEAVAVRDRLEEEKSQLLQRITETENVLSETEDKLHQAQDELIELKDSFDLAVKDRDKAEGELDILKQELDQVRQDQSAQGAELDNLRATASDSEGAIREARQVAEELRDELVQTQAALEAAEQNRNTAVAEKEQWLVRSQQAESVKASMLAELEAKKKEIETLHASASDSEGAVLEARQIAEELRDELMQTQAALEEAQNKCQLALDDKSAAESRIGKAEEDRAAMAADLEAKTGALEEAQRTIGEVSAQRDDLQVHLEHTQEELQDANSELEDLRLKLTEAMEASGILGDVEAAKAEVAEARAQLEQAEQENGSLHGELDALHGELDALRGQIESVTAERDSLHGECESLRTQVLDLQDKDSASSTEMQSLREALDRASSEKSAADAELAGVRDQIAQLQSENQSLREEVERVSSEGAASQTDLADQIAQLQSENASLHEQLASAQSAASDQGDLEAVRAELESTRAAAEEEITALRARVEKFKQQRDEAANACGELDSQVQALKAQLAQGGGGSSACSEFVGTWAPRFPSIVEFAQEIANTLDATQGLDPSLSENAHEMLGALIKVHKKLSKASESLS